MVFELKSLYGELNNRYFEGILPPCEIKWSRRLTRAAGTIDVRARVIKLSVPLLVDAYQTDSLFGASFEVCGLICESPAEALREILKHEMIHLWLHVQGKPCGHTAEFRQKAHEVGQPKTRHGIDLPRPRTGWLYTCGQCGRETLRRRRTSRAMACGICCRQFNRGKYDERFKLKGRRIVPAD